MKKPIYYMRSVKKNPMLDLVIGGEDWSWRDVPFLIIGCIIWLAILAFLAFLLALSLSLFTSIFQ